VNLFTIEQWIALLVSNLATLGTVWRLLRPKVAKEISEEDSISLRFATSRHVDDLERANTQAHNLIVAEIGSVAAHKADIAVRPVQLRVDELERRVGEVLLGVQNLGTTIDKGFEAQRIEFRDEVRRIYDKIDEHAIERA